jgi:hypothetical protein
MIGWAWLVAALVFLVGPTGVPRRAGQGVTAPAGVMWALASYSRRGRSRPDHEPTNEPSSTGFTPAAFFQYDEVWATSSDPHWAIHVRERDHQYRVALYVLAPSVRC